MDREPADDYAVDADVGAHVDSGVGDGVDPGVDADAVLDDGAGGGAGVGDGDGVSVEGIDADAVLDDGAGGGAGVGDGDGVSVEGIGSVSRPRRTRWPAVVRAAVPRSVNESAMVREAAIRAAAVVPGMQLASGPVLSGRLEADFLQVDGLCVLLSGAISVPRAETGLMAERMRVTKRLESECMNAGTRAKLKKRIDVLESVVAAAAVVNVDGGPNLSARPPKTVSEAISGVNGPAWMDALENEMGNMSDFGVWRLVQPPPGVRALGSKWVFDIKRDKMGEISKLKARLVLKGYHQVEGRDYKSKWAPTCRMRTFRMMMAEASGDLSVKSAAWDCTAAFLHADMDCLVYMLQPEAFVEQGSEDKVCELLKAIYGSVQASKLFYDKLRGVIMGLGGAVPSVRVRQSDADECLFVIRRGSEWVKCLTHVDDICVTFRGRGLYDEVFAAMRAQFDITDYGGGELDRFLGVGVSRGEDGSYLLSQEAYIDEVLERLGLSGCASAASPEAPGTRAKLEPVGQLSPAEVGFMRDVPYKAAVGALFYLSRATRFDIVHAVGQVARFMAHPGPQHWTAVLRIYRYLKRTKGVPLRFRAVNLRVEVMSRVLDGFSDADWAGCRTTSKSHTGWVVRVGGAPVAWHSRQQDCISQSTCEAEYVAAASLANELVWWSRLCGDFGLPVNGPINLLCDNKAATSLADHAGKFEATKHIALRYHVLRDHQREGLVRVRWVSGDKMFADIFTKNCGVGHFLKMASHLMGSSLFV